jgi:hypothetical protein
MIAKSVRRYMPIPESEQPQDWQWIYGLHGGADMDSVLPIIVRIPWHGVDT